MVGNGEIRLIPFLIFLGAFFSFCSSRCAGFLDAFLK